MSKAIYKYIDTFWRKEMEKEIETKESKEPVAAAKPVDRGRVNNIMFLAAVVIFATAARVCMFKGTSGDMRGCLIPWYDYLKSHGGFFATGDNIGDYTPAYYYFLALLGYTKIPVVYGIKIFSTVFELLCAVYIGRITAIRYNGTNRPYIAFAIAYSLPTALINSGAWGQCDGVFTCFLLMAFYSFLKGREMRSMWFGGISFAFKLQAVFFAPFILVMFLKRKIRFRSLFMIPLVYIISIIPAILVGGSPWRLLTVYLRQSVHYKKLVMGLANIWVFFEDMDQRVLGYAGVFVAGTGVLIFVYYCASTGKLGHMTLDCAVTLACISCFIVPFLLPYMHERYYYPLEMFIVVFAMYHSDKAWLIVLTQSISFVGIMECLFSMQLCNPRIAAMLSAFAIILLFYTLSKELHNENGDEVKMVFEQPTSVKDT
ncbi:MAG: DUF2029 domain-containing protein [Ruminococcus sp.]|nr:DUF2029 domain-containing protein [Ruminococcus sp.]